MPYSDVSADPSVRDLVPHAEAIIVTVHVASLTDETAARIREEGYSSYVWDVSADNAKTALDATPDYVEFISGVCVKELLAAI